jgi:phytoene synthase
MPLQGAAVLPVGAHAHCERLVRAQDRDRWLASLFAPADTRPHLMALYAFNLEIARLRDVVSDPLPGEMRLQWWRDLLNGQSRGEAAGHPVAAALAETIKARGFAREDLIALIDARVFDLYDDPMPDGDALTRYALDTAGTLLRLSAQVLSPQARISDILRPAALAQALTGLLRSIPWHAARGQMFLPADRLVRHGIDRASYVEGVNSPALARALAELRETVRQAMREVRAGITCVGRAEVAALLPLALVEPYLAAMERPGVDPFRTIIEIAGWRKILLMWRQARRAGAA